MQNEKIVFNNPNCYTYISQNPLPRMEGKVSDMHFHREVEFLYVKSGKMSYTSDLGTFEINSGDIAFFNSNIPHSTAVLKPTTNILIQFRLPSAFESKLKYIGMFLERSNVSEYIFRNGEGDTRELLGYVDAMVDEYNAKENAYDYYLTANIYAITAFLHRKNMLNDDSKLFDKSLFQQVLPVVEYIDENYAERITLNDMGSILNLNEQYFCRLFKKATESTPTEYLNFVRICVAEKLLKSGKNISEASYKAGFSSLTYFNRIFKKYKQCSPSAYKKISARKDMLIE